MKVPGLGRGIYGGRVGRVAHEEAKKGLLEGVPRHSRISMSNIINSLCSFGIPSAAVVLEVVNSGALTRLATLVVDSETVSALTATETFSNFGSFSTTCQG